MIPSKKLRRLISKKNKIQLEDFSWEKELEKKAIDKENTTSQNSVHSNV